MAGRTLSPLQLELDFSGIGPAPRRLSPEDFVRELRRRRVRAVELVRFKPNRHRIITLGKDGRTLHIHTCFEEASDDVLDAVATFLKASRRTQAYRAAIDALREFWLAKGRAAGWAAEEDERVIKGVRELPSSGTREQAVFLAEAYARLNIIRFDNRLPYNFPLRVSDRMASRFGHMRYHTLRDGTRIVLELAVNHNLFAKGHEANLIDTLLHEMTHVEAWLEHGHRAHGPVWKRIARRVGCEPRACSTKRIRRRRRDAGPLTRVPDRAWLPQLPQAGAA